MKRETAKEVAQRMARQAFDAGLRAASQPAAERERQRTYTIGYVGDLVAATLEAEAPAVPGTQTVTVQGLPPREISIEEQIAAVQDAEDYRVTSLGWRQGRRGFNSIRELGNERGMAAALMTLRGLRRG